MTAPPNANLAHLFLDLRIQEGRGHRIALRCPERNWSYAQVQARSLQLAQELKEFGLGREERVLIALPEGADWVCTFFAVLRCGAVVVMANPDLGNEALAQQAAYTRARFVVGTTQRLDDRAARALKQGYEAQGLDRPRLFHPPAESQSQAPYFCVHSLAQEAAIWLFSGGSTGAPKAVMQSHASFSFTTKAYAKKVLNIGPKDITIAAPKLHFGYATGSNLLFPFSVGASCVLNPEPCKAQALAQLIRKHQATILINVPTMIAKMLDAPDLAPGDLASLRLTSSAGEALPIAIHQRWMQRFGIEILDGLGTAEMWHIFLSNAPGQSKAGSLGRAVPGFELRLCDAQGQPVRPGEVGWLWVKGGARAIGYWHRPEQNAQAFYGEWYRSGDLLRQDAEGYYYYCGRSDDLMKVSGKWLAPADVESALMMHPHLASAVVVAAKDEHGLQKPYAFVTLSAAGQNSFDEAQLRDFVARKLEPFKSPRAIYVAKHWPQTHLGKHDRAQLKALVPQIAAGQIELGPHKDLRSIAKPAAKPLH